MEGPQVGKTLLAQAHLSPLPQSDSFKSALPHAHRVLPICYRQGPQAWWYMCCFFPEQQLTFWSGIYRALTLVTYFKESRVDGWIFSRTCGVLQGFCLSRGCCLVSFGEKKGAWGISKFRLLRLIFSNIAISQLRLNSYPSCSDYGWEAINMMHSLFQLCYFWILFILIF